MVQSWTMTNALTIGRCIAAERARVGLTQAQVAERAGTSAAYLSRLERGRRIPSRELLARLLAALRGE